MHPGVELEDSVFTGGESYRGYYKEMKTLYNDWVSGVTSSTCEDVPKSLSCYSTEVCDRNLRDSSGKVRVPQSRRANGAELARLYRTFPLTTSSSTHLHAYVQISVPVKYHGISYCVAFMCLHAPSLYRIRPFQVISSFEIFLVYCAVLWRDSSRNSSQTG